MNPINITKIIRFEIILLLFIIFQLNILIWPMKDFREKKNPSTELSNLHKIVDFKKTQSNIKSQLQIVRKIVSNMTWLNTDILTDDLLYEISKYIFKNPISFTVLVFRHVESKKLKIDSKKSYILVNSNIERQEETTCLTKEPSLNFQNMIPIVNKKESKLSIQYRLHNSFQLGQFAINIKVLKVWKSCKINHENSSYKQIISKSKHFIDFLKNIKIDNPKHPHEFQDNFMENTNFSDKEAKIYTLLCQNYDYILNQITKIQQNQKHKKLDNSIAKTYVEMMNKNILILNVEKNNFSPISYKSQGKYIYFENALKLPLASQKYNRIYSHLQSYKIDQSQLKFIPYLQYNKFSEDWEIKNASDDQIQLFEEIGKQTDRGRGLIMDRLLNCYQYDDYVVRQM